MEAYLKKMEYYDGSEPLTEEEWQELEHVTAEFVATAELLLEYVGVWGVVGVRGAAVTDRAVLVRCASVTH